MKPSILRITPLLGSIAALATTTSAEAQEILRSNDNATALNTAAAWQGGVLPTAADVIVFDITGVPAAVTATTVTATNLMGAPLSVLGIRVANNVGGTINTTQYLGIHNAGSTTPFTLSLGSSGVDMSVANQALRIQAAIALTADQNWVVNNANTANNVMGFNNGEDLSFDATSVAQAFDLGGFTVNASGTGGINITSGFTLSNGTINISNPYFVIQGGGSRVTNISNNVTLNVAAGGLLHFQSNSGAGGASMASSATINLNGGQLRLAGGNATLTNVLGGIINVNSASTLNIGKPLTNTGQTGAPINITGNFAGSGALSFTNTMPNVPVVTLSGDNSGYTGTITFSGTAGRVTRMGSATSGSAAATWDISAGHTLSLNAVSVNFGTLNGAGGVSTHAAGTSTASVGAGTFSGVLSNGTGTLALTKVGAGTLTLGGVNTYTGATVVNGGTLALTGSIAASSRIEVGAGATFDVSGVPGGFVLGASQTLAGVGSLTGGVTVANNGAVAPGDSFGVGTTTFSNLTLGQNPGDVANLKFVLNATTPKILVSAANGLNLAGGAGSAKVVIPTGGFNVGTYTLVDYTGSIGGAGFAGFVIAPLPPRTGASLVDNTANTSVDLVVTGVDYPRWIGNVDGVWDVNNGTGTGTPNWREVISGNSTRYLQGAGGTDSALFDDGATGTRNVILSTTLTPVTITVDNSGLPYTFSGSGNLSGSAGIQKQGTGTLIIANTGVNDNTGGTNIDAGTIQLGDGTTAGAGSLSGSGITNNGLLEFNRPDDYTQAGTITGSGAIRKKGAGTVTLASAITLPGSVTVQGGTLAFAGAATLSGVVNLDGANAAFTAGGTISGPITGNGQITKSGATLLVNGTVPNTNTGLVTTTGGRLDLSTPTSVNAVGGDILIAGNGQLGLLASEVIPNTSSITITSTSTDSIPAQTGQETFLNATVNSTVGGTGGGQLIMRNGMTILGTATVQSGILGVASGQAGTINQVNITSAPGNTGILRIAGSSATSTMNIGAGGITASGGEIQVKFNGNNFDAVLNLGGNFTATGNVAITNGNYNGVNLNVINLTADRAFDIASGTTTTVSPDIAGAGGLTKVGAGTLSLGTLSAGTYAGATLVNDGTLVVNGSISGSGVNVGPLGSLAGAGTINAPVIVSGSLSPGNSPGTLTLGTTDLGFGSAAVSTFELGGTLTTQFDRVVGINALTLDGAFNVSLFGGFNPANGDSFDLLDFTSINSSAFNVGVDLSLPALSPGLNWDTSNFTTQGVIAVVPEPGSAVLLLGGLALLAGRRRRE